MKVIVAHNAPDLDAITSVWLLKRFMPGWHEASVSFVPAGTALPGTNPPLLTDPIEQVEDKEIIHVDTGLGPLDHHQTADDQVCGASLTWDYVKRHVEGGDHWEIKKEAITRMVRLVVAYDHFQEVFFANPEADYHDFSFDGIIDGLKLKYPDDDAKTLTFGMECLDALLHTFENRMWAERDIKHNGTEFQTKWGKGIAFESINDDVLKLAQKMGYVLVVRKDSRKGYIRIKTRPEKAPRQTEGGVDLTPVYEQLKKLDPEATWFLHVSKKMLLNGTIKNPKMKPSSLPLDVIINVLKTV